jgi:hypothetical protein
MHRRKSRARSYWLSPAIDGCVVAEEASRFGNAGTTSSPSRADTDDIRALLR